MRRRAWLDVVRGLLVALAVVAPIAWGKGLDEQLGQAVVATLLITVLALAGLVVRGWPVKLRLQAMDWAALALLALSALSISWAPYRRGAEFSVLRLLVYFLCLWMARSLLTTGFWQRVLLLGLISGGGVVGILGVREYLMTWRMQGDLSWRIFSTFVSPNLTAGLFVMLLPLVVLLLLELGRRERKARRASELSDEWWRTLRPLVITAGLIMLVALALTASKGGAIAAVIALGVLGWGLVPARSSRSRIIRRGTWIAIVAALGLIVLLPPARTRVVAAFTTQFNSTAFRYYLWSGMLQMIRDRPLTGFGTGGFNWSYAGYAVAGNAQLGHNAYLQVGAETGVPGAVAYLALWVALVSALSRPLRERADPAGRAWAAATLAGLAGFLFQNAVDNNWYYPGLMIPLFLLLGMVLGRELPETPGPVSATEERQDRAPGWLRVGGLVVGVGMLAVSGWFVLRYLPAERLKRLAAETRSLPRATEMVRQALRLDAGDVQTYMMLASGLMARGTEAAYREAIQMRLQAARVLWLQPANWRELAVLYAQVGQMEEALQAAATANAQCPYYALGLLTQARVAEMAGRPELVRSSYQKLSALHEGPQGKYPALGDMVETSYLYAWQYLAQDAKRRGEEETAVENWRKMAGLLEKYWKLSNRQRELLVRLKLTSEVDEQAFGMMTREVVGGLRETGQAADREAADRVLSALAEREQARREEAERAGEEAR
ncbi:MAG: hypothetical protein GX100_13610 [candidate division WS1 bacterium]|nr:hypothetical protein [candidate division WS1 bacterium]